MTHRATGIHRILERPAVYERVQRLLGARAARRRIVDDFLRPFDGARILDVGCGTGSLLDLLPESVDYTGFDLNAKYIDTARRRYAGRGRFFCARVGDKAAMLEKGTFDFVVAKSLLHHLSDGDAHQLLAASRNALRSGGVFFSSDPVRHDEQALVTKVLLALDRGGSIRSADGYRELLAAHFESIDGTVVTDLLAIPYSHFIARAMAA